MILSPLTYEMYDDIVQCQHMTWCAPTEYDIIGLYYDMISYIISYIWNLSKPTIS